MGQGADLLPLHGAGTTAEIRNRDRAVFALYPGLVPDWGAGGPGTGFGFLGGRRG